MAPQYDSGDHLHPGPAGHEAMANAVDLALFR
jgi:lysophospholipase L1-like esterase